MRTGNLARELVMAGFSVTWWTSRFNHSLKGYREFRDTPYKIDEDYTRESYATLLQKWHMKKMIEEFKNVNFYSTCEIEECEPSCQKRCDKKVIKKCKEKKLLKVNCDNWNII